MQMAERPAGKHAMHSVARDVSPARGAIVTYSCGEPQNPHSHEWVTRQGIAEKLAALMGYDFVGEHDGVAPHRDRHVFVVPSRTIVGLDRAHALGIESERDLFGGVVPHEFVATKSITHGVIDGDAKVPQGWSHGFAADVRDVVLDGYSAFSVEDARRAGRRLLERGTVRVKPAMAVGGNGQTVVSTADELDCALRSIDAQELSTCGLTLEQNLLEVTTFSVGRIAIDGLVATYFGTQRLATNHHGAEVYGGSDLTVARGEFDALLALRLPRDARIAVEQARVYDAAADRHFEGFFASRRNYDIALGFADTARAERRCGVLEQSWRAGGASGPEVAALECFRHDPALHAVCAECIETYDNTVAPTNAAVYFDGVDEKVGRILKYTVVKPYVDA